MPYMILCFCLSSQSSGGGDFFSFGWDSFGWDFYNWNDRGWVDPVWVVDAVFLTKWVTSSKYGGANGELFVLGRSDWLLRDEWLTVLLSKSSFYWRLFCSFFCILSWSFFFNWEGVFGEAELGVLTLCALNWPEVEFLVKES